VPTPNMLWYPTATATVSINFGGFGFSSGIGTDVLLRYTKRLARYYTFILVLMMVLIYVIEYVVDQAYRTTSGSYTIASGDSHTLKNRIL
jgi:hypothetical protein